MRYRVPVMSVALATMLGLSASSAFADTASAPDTSYHIVTNENTSLGVTYPGPGNQATITNTPGDSSFESAGTYQGQLVYAIHNSNGHCLRMRSAAFSYAVMEENTCDLSDNNERFTVVPITTGTYKDTSVFYDVGTGKFLGESCPPGNGNKVWGEGGNGTCIHWRGYYGFA